jgi:hypothetical protein
MLLVLPLASRNFDGVHLVMDHLSCHHDEPFLLFVLIFVAHVRFLRADAKLESLIAQKLQAL